GQRPAQDEQHAPGQQGEQGLHGRASGRGDAARAAPPACDLATRADKRHATERRKLRRSPACADAARASPHCDSPRCDTPVAQVRAMERRPRRATAVLPRVAPRPRGPRMRLRLLTYGPEGDTRPIAALGHALAGAGHDVRLLANAATVGIGAQLGLHSQALPGDIRGAIAGDGAMRDITRNLARLTNENTGAWLAQAIEAGRGCDAVVVSGLAAFVGLSTAEALGVP